MTTLKPIIKLPPRSKPCSTNRISFQDIVKTRKIEALITNELYFEDVDQRVTDYDIHFLLQEYSVLQIKRERGGGYLSFPDSKIAERVYSLFNGFIFANKAALSLRFSVDDHPQAEGPVLEVNHLPPHIDHNTLYDIFHPFGPLNLCKSIAEHGAHRGKALIQFFNLEDSEIAQKDLNNKYYGGNTISISLFMSRSITTSTVGTNVSTPPASEKNDSYVDYMNLYVKNLDPDVDNNELFNAFRRFGRIVSARVMTNPATGQSKGYGFVSFSNFEDAGNALEELNGQFLRTKPLIVAYHEPKKPRQEKSSSTTTSSFHSPPPFDYVPTPYFEAKHPYEVTPINGLGIDHSEHLAVKDLSVGVTPISMQRKLSVHAEVFNLPPASPPQFNTGRPSLASLASGAVVKTPPSEMVVEKPRLHRRSSAESISTVMTESSAHMQRQKMMTAVQKCGVHSSDIPDVVDMLLTLKRKDRSLCLFNQDFLKQKIASALEALEICNEEDEEEEEVEDLLKSEPLETINIAKEVKRYRPTASPYVPLQQVRKSSISNGDVVIPPRHSKAIPIVAPVIIEEHPHATEIKALIDSLKGKAMHEQKQLLGDELFPLVKATGTKQAPKVTIRLLDTIPLEDLTKLMFDKETLKEKVEITFAGFS
ncbi:hypothetical protein K501DRAFT_206351 [Backusella circina FSU 941]|nr:hypothetical protein K501DRAFT_206351 [Backusella circina FSU 941]